MKRGRSYSEEIRDAAVQRYIAGESARDIATSLGPCKSTIMQWVHECGQSRRQGLPMAALPGIRELWTTHGQLGNWRAVARKHGVALSTVLRRANAQVVP